MKRLIIFISLVLFFVFAFTFSTNENVAKGNPTTSGIPNCKYKFCTCCNEEGRIFDVYELVNCNFVFGFQFETDSHGCWGTGAPPPASLLPYHTYMIQEYNPDCGKSQLDTLRIFFTACTCGSNELDEIILPCCEVPEDRPNSQHNDNNTISNQFALLQNFPNPFNPSTTIKFAIPSEQYVKLTVYDAAGKQIETLINGITKAGIHDVSWNATNFASGIYFYKLTAGDFSAEKKMVVIK